MLRGGDLPPGDRQVSWTLRHVVLRGDRRGRGDGYGMVVNAEAVSINYQDSLTSIDILLAYSATNIAKCLLLKLSCSIAFRQFSKAMSRSGLP